jgi:hypothetical protein
MKNIKQKILLFLIFCVALLSLFSSCKKFVQIPDSKDEISNNLVFTDSADATAAIINMYIYIMNSRTIGSPLEGYVTLYTSLSSDELVPKTGSATDLQFYQNFLNSSNVGCSIFWSAGYQLIYQANACIEGISSSKGLTITAQNQLLGEAKFMRALNYFHLVNLFGPVPLVLTSNYSVNQSLPRASEQSIYKQIVADLVDAQALMGSDYVTVGKVRPNRFTATSLLAKAYLYEQKWDSAQYEASQVINSGSYSIVAADSVFLANSDEAIWQLLPINLGNETAEGVTFIPSDSTVIPQYTINTNLLNAFEGGDRRRATWIDSNIVNGIIYYYPFKYRLGRDGNSNPLENYMVMRLGELYLIRAEAEAQLNSLQAAVNDVNILRSRAGLIGISISSQSNILDAIYHERQIELFCEWGNRWYDLKRTQNVTSVMDLVDPVKGGSWNINWAVYPLPLSEIQANPSLVQNEGY